jgi:hypothetical protein
MTKLHTAEGNTIELDPDAPVEPTDIRVLKLAVLKNAVCFACFAGLGGYALSAGKHGTIKAPWSIIMYIVTIVGIFVFIPRLGHAVYKFMASSPKVEYRSLIENEKNFQY